MLNSDSDQSERLWRIFPTGGLYSRVGDACAVVIWLLLVIVPIVAIVVSFSSVFSEGANYVSYALKIVSIIHR